MEGPPLGPGGEDITWRDHVAPRGRKSSSTRKIKPQTSNLCEERLGVGDPHVPEARRARGLYLYGCPHVFPALGSVLGVAAPEIFDGALAVSRRECAQVADVLFEGGCLPLQLLL